MSISRRVFVATLSARSCQCEHTSAYVSIRQHTSAYVSIRQHTSAVLSVNNRHREQTRKHTDNPTSQLIQTKRELRESFSVVYMSPPLCHGLSSFHSFYLSCPFMCLCMYMCMYIYMSFSHKNMSFVCLFCISDRQRDRHSFDLA
jgi:hypothetical protein